MSIMASDDSPRFEAGVTVEQAVVEGHVVPSESRRGIYQLPVVGKPAAKVRDFYDDMRPLPDDSVGVVVGKQALRYGAVVAGGVAGVAVGAIVAL